jgi:uncharacterized protein (DUF983 family)
MSEPPGAEKATTILIRGFRNRCPNCGQRTLFQPGRYFKVAHTCRSCGLPIDRGGGFFLGPVSINYGIVAFGIVAPLILLGVIGVLPLTLAVILGGAGAVLLPILLYRSSWSLWVAGFYLLFPHLMSPGGREAHDDAEF